MCKIADDLKPHPLFLSFFKKLTDIFPTWKLVPSQDIIDVAIKDPQKRQQIRSNPYVYQGRPRLKTGYELVKTSIDIEKRLDEVTLPFLVLHGEEDKVTDPSQMLYSSAKSFDKMLKLYPELPHHRDLVFHDIISWLHNRSPQTASETVKTTNGSSIVSEMEI